MLSVSDILKLLEQIPAWKTVKALPGRVEAVERRLNELEGKPKRADHLHTCETCGKPARVTEIQDHPTLGTFGVKIRRVTCEDGHAIDYMWDPAKD